MPRGKQNLRIAIAILLVVGSLLLVFGVVGFGSSGTSSEDLTTLQFGLQLDGGTRFTVPLYGVTAEDVAIDSSANQPQIARRIASSLGITPTDVNIRSTVDKQTQERTYYIEVTHKGVTTQELEQTLKEQNIDYDVIREGVTEKTLERTVNVINDKINEAGLSGGTARTVTSATGERFVLIEVPGENREYTRNLLNERGSVRVDIYYPTTNESGEEVYRTRKAVLEPEDFQNIGTATENARLGPHVPVTLTESAARDFREAVSETGMIPNGSNCYYEEQPQNTGPCLLTKVDGEVVYSAGMSPSLARDIKSGEWSNAPQFVLQTGSLSQAQELTLHLNAGALPTGLDFENGTSVYVSPTQGERFKLAGLIIGLTALIGVGAKVFLKYRDIRVAAPMIAMSVSEVIILLGFASLVGYPIELAVIAGFVAVIGTGVDDLIIIANEVLAGGTVTSKKVFSDRYNKAFWVILAAAITTSIALSPLIILSLGQLAGFAIFTIFGIAVGVFITRPAYGEILTLLLTDR